MRDKTSKLHNLHSKYLKYRVIFTSTVVYAILLLGLFDHKCLVLKITHTEVLGTAYILYTRGWMDM